MVDLLITEAAPDAVVPTLWEGPELDLPPGAVLNGDGSVTVTLRYPFDLAYRQGAETIRSERVAEVTLRRLTGADVLKITKAKDAARAAIVAAAGLTPARFELWCQKLDASDETLLGQVVTEMMGVGRSGLPEQAEDRGDAVLLRLLFPAEDDQGTAWSELRFPRMTAAQRRRMTDADESLVWAVQHATGLTPKGARALLVAMDAADAAAITRVLGFLA